MKSSLNNLKICYELIADPVVAIKASGEIVFCNNSFENEIIDGFNSTKHKDNLYFQNLGLTYSEEILSDISIFDFTTVKFYSKNICLRNKRYKVQISIDKENFDEIFICCFEGKSGLCSENHTDTLSDIEEIEEKLIESEEKYRLIFEKSNDAILLLDGDIWIDCNESALRMLGYTKKTDIIGKMPSELSPVTQESGALSTDKAKEMIYLGFQKGYHQFEWIHQKANSELFYAEVMLTVIPINNKHVLHTVWRDISSRKQVFAEREQAVQTMIEATEKKHEALKVLDNSARLASIGVITAGITHEINQPVNAIKIGTEGILSWNLANGRILPQPIVSLLEGVSTATGRITDIIKHMRGIWIDQSGSALEKVDINRCVSQSLNLAKMRVQSHEIKFVTEMSNEELLVEANHLQLELVINNLIVNSVFSLDKTDRKDKIIKISTYKVENKVYLSVYDNGKGFAEADLPKLFDPFYSSRHSDGGTGLGLAIVKMFLDRFGAKINAISNDTGGATMIINFESIK